MLDPTRVSSGYSQTLLDGLELGKLIAFSTTSHKSGAFLSFVISRKAQENVEGTQPEWINRK